MLPEELESLPDRALAAMGRRDAMVAVTSTGPSAGAPQLAQNRPPSTISEPHARQWSMRFQDTAESKPCVARAGSCFLFRAARRSDLLRAAAAVILDGD